MSILRFVQWVEEGRPIVLYGDGSQERDFTYIDDIVRGTLAALQPLGFEVKAKATSRISLESRYAGL